QLVRPRPYLDRFLAAGQRLGDGAQAHALAGKQMELLDLVLPPRLAVAFESFSQLYPLSSAYSPHLTSPHRESSLGAKRLLHSAVNSLAACRTPSPISISSTGRATSSAPITACRR